MTSVAKLWGKAPRYSLVKVEYEWPLPEQLMGIEVELERMGNPGAEFAPATLVEPYWRSEHDGSLRNGTEYVLDEPLAGTQLATAIHRLYTHNGFKRHPYGSTHIHLDMCEQDTDLNVFQALCMLVYLTEDAIFQIADPAREWCGFTNKLTTAPERFLSSMFHPEVLVEGSKAQSFLYQTTDRHERYYGLNIAALQKYGSIEFRYFPTAESADELISWTCLVQSYKKAAKELGGLQAVRRVIEDDASFEAFVATYFQPWQGSFIANVSSKRARQMFDKALAHTHLQALPVRSRTFKSAAITGRSNLSRFARVIEGNEQTPAPEYNILAPTYGEEAPRANRQPLGTILVYDTNFYLNLTGNWLRVDHSRLNPAEFPSEWVYTKQYIKWHSSLKEKLVAVIDRGEDGTVYPDYVKRHLHTKLDTLLEIIKAASDGTNIVVAPDDSQEDEE